MADATYHKFITNALWRGLADVIGTPVVAMLCTSAYTSDTSITGDEFRSDVPSGAIIAEQALSGVTLTDGVLDALDTLFPAVASGHVISQIILRLDASPPSSGRLFRKIDAATNLPLTTDGTDITVVWPNDANKILNTHDA